MRVAKDARDTLPSQQNQKGKSMKVNYQSLATSGVLALAVVIGASDLTSAQGRRGRDRGQEAQGQENRQENQDAEDNCV